MRHRGNRIRCGSLDSKRAAMFFGILDIILGIIGLFVSMKLWRIDHKDKPSTYSHFSRYSRYSNQTKGIDYAADDKPMTDALWITLISCFGIQLVMGTFLIVGAAYKLRYVVVAWIVTAVPTALCSGIIFRLGEMFIMYRFVIELKEEEVTTMSGPDGSPYLPPIVATPVLPFQPPANVPNLPAFNPNFPEHSNIEKGFHMPSRVPSSKQDNVWQQVPRDLLPPPNYETAVGPRGYKNETTWENQGINSSAPNQFSKY